jgi:maltooligosyltrehalose trehalohydrolase
MKIGANYLGNNKCVFTVWAPLHQECVLIIVSHPEKEFKMERIESGYFQIEAEDIPPGTKYFYAINNRPFPDPASNFQPDGVHGPSEVIDHTVFKWRNKVTPVELKDLIIYELHIGVFTPEGTFRAAAGKLDHLKNLGITAVEIMPVAQYPGNRNWGYDGVNPFAPQNSYGRPEDMKYFIDKCHEHGLNVILDVVYNHFGPEGNYMNNFGPYFTPAYRTPWGDAINFDHAFSDEVRNYFFRMRFTGLKNLILTVYGLMQLIRYMIKEQNIFLLNYLKKLMR